MITPTAKQRILDAGANEVTSLIPYGVFRINEIRAAYDLDPIEGGDVAYMLTPSGAVAVEDAALLFKLPPADG